MQIKDWLKKAQQALVTATSDSPKLDAEVLATHALAKNRAWLYAFDDYQLSSQEQELLERLLSRRLQGEPVAYITGSREFWSLSLATNASTLIPRPDTETLVEWALELELPEKAQVLDLGTGTGAIALALASEHPLWQVQGVDANEQAVELAKTNAASNLISLQTNDGHPRVQFYTSNWFSQVQGEFHLIVSNPPYIDKNDEHLHQGDVRFEPHSALVAEQQGLDDLVRIIAASPEYLVSGGWLLLEHGYQQAEAVQALLQERGFVAISTRHDLADQPRITAGQWLKR